MLMSLFVRPVCLFVSCFLWKQICGKSNRIQDGGRHKSKLQLELKISVDIHPKSASENNVAVQLLTTSYSNKLIKTSSIRCSRGEFKFGQKSVMHSKCNNMKIHVTKPAALTNCQKSLILANQRSLQFRKMKPSVDNSAQN